MSKKKYFFSIFFRLPIMLRFTSHNFPAKTILCHLFLLGIQTISLHLKQRFQVQLT